MRTAIDRVEEDARVDGWLIQGDAGD